MANGRDLRVGVLCIQGAFIEHVHMLEATGSASVVDVRSASDLSGLDGLIIPGGESTTLSVFLKKDNFIDELRSWVLSGSRVVWGTCAGLILLSSTVTGQRDGGQITIGGLAIECSRNDYGRQISSFEAKIKLHDPALFESGEKGDEFHGVFIRAPAILKVSSPDVKVLATLEDGSAVAVAQGHLMATSFHPELTGDSRWHSYFLQLIKNVQNT